MSGTLNEDCPVPPYVVPTTPHKAKYVALVPSYVVPSHNTQPLGADEPAYIIIEPVGASALETAVANLAEVTAPLAIVVVLPVLVTSPVRFALVVTVLALPLRVAVIVPALKLPLESRATIALAVLALVAVVALFEILPAVEIVLNLVSAILPASIVLVTVPVSAAVIAVPVT
jgi:hypothetical protein